LELENVRAAFGSNFDETHCKICIVWRNGILIFACFSAIVDMKNE